MQPLVGAPPAETLDDRAPGAAAGAPVPGVVLIVVNGEPVCIPFRTARPLEVGRQIERFSQDDRLSRQHLRVDAKAGHFRVRDLGSRNGTFVDGVRVEGGHIADAGSVVRAGRTLLLLVDDVRPFENDPVVVRDGEVVGPRLRETLATVRVAATEGDNLLVLGESGCGKERIARHVHGLRRPSKPAGPFVAVNCATIPEGVAERLLLGARRGAFSGATDSEGWLQAADGGVLFLDEIGELDLDVQSKLLRVLETGEVTPLGATRPVQVRPQVVFATHRDLRASVARGTFRADLFYRIEQPVVLLPPLRERREEIPFYVAMEIERRKAPPPHPALIEACMLRPWPGNVRELLHNVRAAAVKAMATRSEEVMPEHLDARAGYPLETPKTPTLDLERVKEELQRHDGNVTATARALGVHRNQLRRLLGRSSEDGD